MIYKLKRVGERSLSQIEQQVAQGAKFVVFPYVISPLAFTVNPMSKAYFVLPDENAKSFASKYNVITILFGWWGIPHGPEKSYRSLKMNADGGLDITRDVMANLTESSLQNGEVLLQQVENVFIHPKRSTQQDIRKALQKHFKSHTTPLSVYTARYVNIEEGAMPINTIAFPMALDEEMRYAIEKSIRKYFYPHVPFHYFFLDDDPDLGAKIQEQGVEMKIV
ncbi:MAG: hypothetical protein AAFP02_07490 [Bacteroidota bacterium]